MFLHNVYWLVLKVVTTFCYRNKSEKGRNSYYYNISPLAQYEVISNTIYSCIHKLQYWGRERETSLGWALQSLCPAWLDRRVTNLKPKSQQEHFIVASMEKTKLILAWFTSKRESGHLVENCESKIYNCLGIMIERRW